MPCGKFVNFSYSFRENRTLIISDNHSSYSPLKSKIYETQIAIKH